MDPFTHNLIGQIRQQEILEEAGVARDDVRPWHWRLDTFQIEMWQGGDDAARTPPYLIDDRLPFHRLRSMLAVLLPRLRRRAKQFAPSSFVPQDGSAASQVLTDPQCASEC